MAVEEALGVPGGADYPRAIQAYASSDRPSGVKQAQIGKLIVFARDDPKPGKLPTQSVSDGLRMLEAASVSDGEGAKIAAETLRVVFESGVGTGAVNAVAPDAALAACWRGVQTRAAAASACVAQRART